MSKTIDLKPRIQDAIAIIDSWLEYTKIMGTVPGIAAAVVHKDEIVFNKAYGFSNLSTGKQLNKDEAFRIASISKTFTAISILQLVEKGKLRLDDRASDYLEWLVSKNDKSIERITVRQLLTHTSGMRRDGIKNGFWILEEDFLNKDQLIEQIHDTKNPYPNNEKFKYSNFGPSVLGQLIEKVTGITYKEYVEVNIIKPLGLKNTGPDYDRSNASRMATGHGRYIPGKQREEYPHVKTHAMSPATGFYSNTEDLCKYIAAQFLDNDKLIDRESKKEMQRVQWITDDDEIKRGLGCGIWKVDDAKVIGHSGGFPGFITQISWENKNQLGVIVLTNSWDGMAAELADTMFHFLNHIVEKYDDYQENKVSNINKYTGRFTMHAVEVDIRKINQELVAFYLEGNRPLTKPYRLKQISENEFEILSGSEYGYIGEKISYQFDQKGKIKRIHIGAMPYDPFDSVMEKLRDN
ncbi:MAG: class A beta-lactamase-related serine hydrolase [Gaiellales bacterium]|nr:MAG: class A beta-lactamase-related serine hydrolase [Gaiellales bacterium]